MHMTRFSRPERHFAVSGVSRFMSEPKMKYLDVIDNIMQYKVTSLERGIILAPKGKWDGSRNNELKLSP